MLFKLLALSYMQEILNILLWISKEEALKNEIILRLNFHEILLSHHEKG